MSLSRRQPMKSGRVTFSGMDDEKFRESVEHILNELRSVVMNRSVVLEQATQSSDPEDGELLFTGSALYLVVDGVYEQVWP